MDLAELNHVLIPSSKSARDRYRNTWLARRLLLLSTPFMRLSREGRALLVMASVAAVFGGDLGRTESYVLVLATASLLASAFLLTRAYRLSGVTAELSSPRRVTLGDEIALTLSLRNGSKKEHRSIRWEPPLLPWDGAFIARPNDIDRLPAGGFATTTMRARFVARGEHHLDPFRAVALAPLGLSQGAPLRTSGARFVVVPKVARVVSITTPVNRRHQPGGIARASRTGDATDLLGVRPYRPGDPVRDLHARSWARHGTPMVREYHEEYFTRIGVVVDTDSSARRRDEGARRGRRPSAPHDPRDDGATRRHCTRGGVGPVIARLLTLLPILVVALSLGSAADAWPLAITVAVVATGLAVVGPRWELDRGRQMVTSAMGAGAGYAVAAALHEWHVGLLNEGWTRLAASALLAASARFIIVQPRGGRIAAMGLGFANLLATGQHAGEPFLAFLGPFLPGPFAALRTD